MYAGGEASKISTGKAQGNRELDNRKSAFL
jgi:hypothetical protein